MDATPRRGEFIAVVESVIAAILAILSVYLAVTEPLTWVPYVLCVVIAAPLLLARWPYGALLSLMIAAAMPRFSMTIGSWHAETEHLVAAAGGLILLVRLWRKEQEWNSLERADLLLLVFVAMNFVSSYAGSPDPSSTLRWALLQTLAISPYFLVRQLIDSGARFEKALTLLLVVGAGEALFGLLCFASYILFGTKLGITNFFYLSFIPGVHGSQWEPNIFGSYCTCFAVMFLFYFLVTERDRFWYLMSFLLTTVAVLLSLARQGWACLIIVGGLVVLYNQRHNRIPWRRLAPLAAAIAIAIGTAFAVMRDLPERLETLAVSKALEDPTVAHRLMLLAFAGEDIKDHPIIGQGSSSFKLLHTDFDDTGENAGWLGILFVRITHDTGVVGMSIFLWFIFHIGRRAWKILAARTKSAASMAVAALSAGAMVMLIAYQLTDASTLAFTWIHFGMLVAAIRLAESQNSGVLESRS